MQEQAKVKKKARWRRELASQWQLWVLLLPAIISLILFHYVPMYGVSIAFKDVHIGQSLLEGEWVGFKHFQRLFTSDIFGTLMKNTLSIAAIKNFLLWPLPIIFALIVHNSKSKKVRKFTQTVSYLPNLISTVVVVCIIDVFCNYETGLINIILEKMGMESVYFAAEGKYFLPMYFISDVWVTMGAEAVVYIAALSAVDTQLVEAAQIDGANKLQRIWHVDIPAILPTVVLMQIMNMGKFMNISYEKVLLMQNDLNLAATEIIGTYVYKTGLQGAQYSFSTAVSLFNNIIGLILVIVANKVAKKFTETALF